MQGTNPNKISKIITGLLESTVMDATGVDRLRWERGFETPQMTVLKEMQQGWLCFKVLTLIFSPSTTFQCLYGRT